MSTPSTLCAEITKANMSVIVEGIIINKRAGRAKSNGGGNIPFNFVIKDIVGDTANVVYWDRPGELLKINLLLLIGNAFRFSFLKSIHATRSRHLDPKTTCPYVLQMYRWSVEKLPEQTEQKLMEIFHSPPQELHLTSIAELLCETTSRQISLMAVVVSVGEQRRVELENGESATALDIEVADSSAESIIVTLWDPELTAFIKDQIIVWDSVILLQDAKLKCPRTRSNYVTTSTQTLITPNVTGRTAIMTQRAVGKARTKGFQPRKIHEVPKNTPMYSSNLPPQWITLKVIADFFASGVWPENSDPFKPMVSILLVSKIVSITLRMVCPKCDKVVRAPQTRSSDDNPASNDFVCGTCKISLGSDCRQTSMRITFSDSNGGVAFLLNNTDLNNMLGGLPSGALEESTLKELVGKQLFRRFVVVFQILDFNSANKSLNLRTIRVYKPVVDDWTAYLQALAP